MTQGIYLIAASEVNNDMLVEHGGKWHFVRYHVNHIGGDTELILSNDPYDGEKFSVRYPEPAFVHATKRYNFGDNSTLAAHGLRVGEVDSLGLYK